MTGSMRSIGYHARRSKTVANFVIERAVPRKTGTPHHSKLAVRRNRSPRAQPSVSAGSYGRVPYSAAALAALAD